MIQKNILQNIRELINSARKSVNRHIDSTMTLTYFLVGRYIVEDEQQGEERAMYAKETLKFLSENLTKEFGKGFSERNLALMKKFYLVYKEEIISENILQTEIAKLYQDTENVQNDKILQTPFAKSYQGIQNQLNTLISFKLSWASLFVKTRKTQLLNLLCPKITIKYLQVNISFICRQKMI